MFDEIIERAIAKVVALFYFQTEIMKMAALVINSSHKKINPATAGSNSDKYGFDSLV